MDQHAPADQPYGEGNTVPVTALASEIARELDFEIKTGSDYAFSFKGLDEHSGPYNAYVSAQGDQCYADLNDQAEQTSDEMEGGDTVSTKEQAIAWLRKVFAEAQAADVPL